MWKSNPASTYKMNKIEFQRIENLHVKAAYAVIVASDKIMSSNLLQEQSKELITPFVDAFEPVLETQFNVQTTGQNETTSYKCSGSVTVVIW